MTTIELMAFVDKSLKSAEEYYMTVEVVVTALEEVAKLDNLGTPEERTQQCADAMLIALGEWDI